MLIERTATAVRTLSVRTDEEMHLRTRSLATSLGTDPSTIMRLAIAEILARANRVQASSLAELMSDAA